MNTIFRPVLGLVLGAAAVFAPAMSQPVQAQTTLTLNHYMGFGHPFIQGLLIPWGEEIARLTEGRVTLDIPNGPITNRNEQWNSITGGVADLSIHFDGARAQQLQLMQMVALPFNSAPTAAQSSVALWRTYNEFFADAGEFDDVELLSVWTVVANYAWSKEAITDIAQFDGLKILTSGGLPSDVLTTVGATPVVAGGPQFFELVSGGAVDAVALSPDGLARFKLGQFMTHGLAVPGSLYNQNWSLIVNKDSWNGISEADRAAIMSVSGEVLATQAGEQFDTDFAAGLETLASEGMDIAAPSPALLAALQDRLSSFEADYIAAATAKGIDAEAALAFYRDQIGN